MRLGIDFGTTRIVAAAVDRGNYPVASFETADGTRSDWFPPLVAVRNGELAYGWDAWQAQQESGSTVIRSMKRYLEDAGPETRVLIAGFSLSMFDVLTDLVRAFRQALVENSSLGLRKGKAIEVMLGVPANANGNQRFLTVEAFRRAGFEVLGLLNEPSAASIEFTHANKDKPPAHTRGSVLVYDLGGGTFDTSLVSTDDQTHSVIATEGIPTLGGDDFDGVLANMALDAAGITEAERDSLTQAQWFQLLEECRQKKEALHPNTRKISVDLESIVDGWMAVTVPAADYYNQCRPLVDETMLVVQDILNANQADPDAIYITGGGSELPLVPRALREVYGRRVRRSSYTRSATAIGLAIQADEQAGYVLKETFTRNFGVWREADSGQNVVFDPLFEKGTALPRPRRPALRVVRRYRPVHNIGHFRYLECRHRGDDGCPLGDFTVWDEILFPFDPTLQEETNLSEIAVSYCDRAKAEEIEENYSCSAGGTVTVTISNLTSGYRKRFRLGRWSAQQKPLVPGNGRSTRALRKKT